MPNAPELVGKSQFIRDLRELIKTVAASDTTVLITGETGTGKELVAQSIHEQSARSRAAFVPVNCPGLSETLIESELFGHEKGSFTGADKRHAGKFEQAQGGTIFLDEIGSVSLAIQAKLLRVLQQRTIQRVGGTSDVPLDVRFLVASNEDFDSLVSSGKFRADLFHRLNVVNIHVTPLRDRPDDVLPILYYYLDHYNHRLGKNVEGFSEQCRDFLTSYRWPGNVRECANLAENLVTLQDMPIIGMSDLPSHFFRGKLDPDTLQGVIGSEQITFREAEYEFQRWFFINALESHGWNMRATSRALEIHRNTLTNHLNKLGIASASIEVDDDSFDQKCDEYQKYLLSEALKETDWNKAQAAKILRMNRTTLIEKLKKYGLLMRDDRMESYGG